MFALSLYTITHKFTLSLPTYKGKIKGKKISQQDITECGNRETVMYVRIYNFGGLQNETVHLQRAKRSLV